MSRVQASVLTFLLLAALFAPFPFATAEHVEAGQAAPASATSAASDGAVGPSGTVESFVGAGAIDADRIEFRITIYENASARWTFTYTRTLQDADERQQFEDFAAEFNENETETYRDFRRQATKLVETGSNRTGRDMTAIDFSREAHLGGDCIEIDRCGTVRMSFLWTEFARQDGDRLVVDDVFEGGLYLAENERFVVEAGPGLQFQAAAPETYTATDPELRESSSVTWHGEQQFSDRRPRVVFVRVGDATPTVGATGSPGVTATDRSGPIERASSTWMLLVGLLVVAIGAGVALVWRRSEGGLITGRGDGVASEPAVADEELLSDEDRVLQLLRENGGRMKQVDIVEETGWSKSKVSMLLSDMEDDDQISKLRVGRENIVSLVGHEPDAAGSPHEE